MSKWAWIVPVVVAVNLATASVSASEEAVVACERLGDGTIGVDVCTVDVAQADLRLFLRDPEGTPYGGFKRLEAALAGQGKQLVFAMNAGMYHENLSPVGLYVEDGRRLKRANANAGPGNFHLLPNGVFWIDGVRAGVAETNAFLASRRKPAFATQSGPMLVIDGELHPRFLVDSSSRKIRNGVGVRDDGRTAIFAISRGRVTFHQFATFFRDTLRCRNALFLDGSISSLHAASLKRSDRLFRMGPIVAVVE